MVWSEPSTETRSGAISNPDGHHLAAEEDNDEVTGLHMGGGDKRRVISIGDSRDSSTRKEEAWFLTSG